MPEPFLPIFGKENTWIGRWSKQERWRENEIKSLLASVFTCFIQHYFFPLLVYSSFKTETLQDRDHSFSFSFPQIQPGLKQKKKATHSSILAWKIPWTRRAWGGYSHGVTKRRTRLSGWAQHRYSLGLAYCMGNMEGDWNERNRATALGVSRMQHTERWEWFSPWSSHGGENCSSSWACTQWLSSRWRRWNRVPSTQWSSESR